MGLLLHKPSTEGIVSAGTLEQSVAIAADDQLMCWCCLINWHSQESKATGWAAFKRSKRTGDPWRKIVLSLESRCIWLSDDRECQTCRSKEICFNRCVPVDREHLEVYHLYQELLPRTAGLGLGEVPRDRADYRSLRRSLLAYLGGYWNKYGRALTRENPGEGHLLATEPMPDGSMHPYVRLIFETRRDLKLDREREEAKWASDVETDCSDVGSYSSSMRG